MNLKVFKEIKSEYEGIEYYKPCVKFVLMIMNNYLERQEQQLQLQEVIKYINTTEFISILIDIIYKTVFNILFHFHSSNLYNNNKNTSVVATSGSRINEDDVLIIELSCKLLFYSVKYIPVNLKLLFSQLNENETEGKKEGGKEEYSKFEEVVMNIVLDHRLCYIRNSILVLLDNIINTSISTSTSFNSSIHNTLFSLFIHHIPFSSSSPLSTRPRILQLNSTLEYDEVFFQLLYNIIRKHNYSITSSNSNYESIYTLAIEEIHYHLNNQDSHSHSNSMSISGKVRGQVLGGMIGVVKEILQVSPLLKHQKQFQIFSFFSVFWNSILFPPSSSSTSFSLPSLPSSISSSSIPITEPILLNDFLVQIRKSKKNENENENFKNFNSNSNVLVLSETAKTLALELIYNTLFDVSSSSSSYSNSILSFILNFHFKNQNQNEIRNEELNLKVFEITDLNSNINENINGFVGLKNGYCICYMNSLLQQLYMTPNIRFQIFYLKMLKNYQRRQQRQRQVSNVVDSNIMVEGRQDDILSQLIRMFSFLMLSLRQSYDITTTFCKYWKQPAPDAGGSSVVVAAGKVDSSNSKQQQQIEFKDVNLNEQQDAHEFWNRLFDTNLDPLPLTGDTKEMETVTNIWTGTERSTLSDAAGHTSETCNATSSITFHVKECGVLEDAVKMYTEGTRVVWNCADCGHKEVEARKTVLWETLPQILVFHLDRGDYELNQTNSNQSHHSSSNVNITILNANNSTSGKDNSKIDGGNKDTNEENIVFKKDKMKFEFGEYLNMKQYCISSKEGEDYYHYKLVGILVHRGESIQSGHFLFLYPGSYFNQLYHQFFR